MNKAKIISLALVLAMLVGAFGMVMPMAGAETVSPDNNRNLELDSLNWGEDGTNLDEMAVYVGDQDVNFYVNVLNDWGGTANDDNPIRNAYLEIATTIKTESGSTAQPSPITHWDYRGDNTNAIMTLWDGNEHKYQGFQFDVLPNAVPGTYNLTVTLTFENETNVAGFTWTSYIIFEILARGIVSDLPYNDLLRPGDIDKPVEVRVWSEGSSWNSEMIDVTLAITLPDNDFSWFGLATNTETAPSNVIWGSGNWDDFSYLITVSSDKNAGIYQGTYTLTYTNPDDIVCTETGDIDFIVEQLAMLAASVSGGRVTIEQGTTTMSVSVTFTNVGTVGLFNIRVWVDEYSKVFTFGLADHWEGGSTVSYDWVEIGDLAVDETATATIEVGVNQYIPEGLHKIMLGFDGMYYDDTYLPVEVTWWTNDPWENPPYIPRVDMTNSIFTLDPDSSSVDGCFIWVDVTDTAMDVAITSDTELNAGRKLIDNTLWLDVQNFGFIDYENVVLRMATNAAGIPFLNVVAPTATLSEETILGDLDAQSTVYSIPMYVTLKADTDPGVYMVPVTITGINADMGELVSTVVNARVTIRGIGPQLEVTTVAPEKIKAGKAFTLSVTFTNIGDDTARNIIINSADWFSELLFINDQQTTTDGNYAQPQPNALPLYIGDLAPGATVTVDIPMMANSDMSGGHVYSMTFAMDYVDSFGYGPSTDTFQVSVKSSGMGGSVLGMLYWSLVILVLIIAIFLIIYSVFYVKRNKKPKASAHEYRPPMQEQHPIPPQEDLVEP